MAIDFKRIKFIDCDSSDNDFQLLRTIHKLCMEENVKNAIGVWDDNFQHKRLKSHYEENGDTLRFIEYENEIIGTINVHTKNFGSLTTHYIQQLYLKPNYQKTGLGSYLLNYFSENKHMRLSVLKNDLKAIRFYERNGFTQYDQDQYQLYLEKSTISNS